MNKPPQKPPPQPLRERKPTPQARAQARQQALARWESEGGADLAVGGVKPAGPQDTASEAESGAGSETRPDPASGSTPASPREPSDSRKAAGTDAETDQLRMRVLALENLVIALLAHASPDQRSLAVDMGDFISPRLGYTPHPLTLRAAQAMRSLLDRADRFRQDESA